MAYRAKQELFQMLWCFGQVPEFRSTFSPCCLGWPTRSSHLQRICHFPAVPKQKIISKVTLLPFAGLRVDRTASFNRCGAASVFHLQDDSFSSFFLKKQALKWWHFAICQWQDAVAASVHVGSTLVWMTSFPTSLPILFPKRLETASLIPSYKGLNSKLLNCSSFHGIFKNK